MSDAYFDDSASACAIDALSIVCKRSTPGSEAFLNFDNEEVENVYSIIKSGEASRNDLEDASSSNILWCSIVLLLKNNTYFAGPEDVTTMASDLPVHVQRFFGALFSTFEVLMDHQRSNHAYLVVSLVQLMGRDIANVQTTVIQMTREYKSMFSYAYMFNRRTGAHPVSQVQQVSNYFEHAAAQVQVQVTDIVDSDRIMILDDDDDDNDSYERLMRANTGSFNAPKFGAPSVMPLRPVKMLSDDEHYGSDYQPAIASDLETDITYNSNSNNHHRAHEDSHGALQDDSIFSMDGGSILNSYYKYNGWNNAVEEDEDSDNDHYAPPVVEPARPKRMTRMRQATSRSFDNNDAQESKGKKVRKKKPKKGTTKTSAPLSGQGSGEDAKQKLLWASMANKGILSDDSDESNDDEESDYSESDHIPVQQRATHVPAPAPSASVVTDTHRNVPFISSSRAGPAVTQVQNDEVEEFELDDDAYTPTTRANPAPSHTHQSTGRSTSQGHAVNSSTSSHGSANQGYGRRRDTDAHSPSSGNNSSIELSDRERRKDSPPTRRNTPSSSAASDWRSGNNRTQPHSHAQDRVQARSTEPARRTGGRMRSVLSDDESDTDEVVTSTRQPAVKAVPVRNPLDASIETPGFVVFKNSDEEKRSAGTSRNPLDQSIELPRSSGNNAVSSSADWARSGTSSSASKHAAHMPPAAVSAPAARSVVRLPSASPSKPAAASNSWAGHQGRGATEGSGADLVEDWDSQSDEDQASPQPVVVVRRDTQTRGNVSTAAPLRSALSTHGAEPSQAERRRPERGEESPQVSPQKSPASDVSPSRAAEMERLRQNILQKKREKEASGSGRQVRHIEEASGSGRQDRHIEPPSRSSEPKRSAEIVPATNPQRDPSPSTLRKSVTFEDQNSRAVAPVAAAAAPRGTRQPPAEEEHLPLVAPLQHRSVTGSAADMVLYGSQQSASWKYPEGAENESSSEEDSQNPLDSPYDERDRHQSLGVAGTGMRELELPPQANKLPLRQEQSSPKVPPSRPQQPSYAPPLALSEAVFAPPLAPLAPALPAPTLSRVTSDQFMPVRAPQQEPSREPVRDSRVAASRQFSSSNLSVSASISRPLLTLPGNFVPPPLSEFAVSSGIIMEGYLHKKSGMLGIWQKRYFVLSESTTHFCVLRIFTRAVAAGWGPVAVGLKASIPIHSIEAVESVAAPTAKGKEFTIKFHPRVSKQSLSAGADRDSDAGSDAGSEFSDSMFATGGTKLTTLLAEDAQTRLLWVTMLTRVLAIAVEEV